MFTQGTFSHSVWRGFVSLIAFSIPLLVLQMPVEWQSMTIGTLLMIIAHFVEKRLA